MPCVAASTSCPSPSPFPRSQLGAKLKKEWPGIFNWAIDDCLEWQEQGLNPPKIVTEATEEYLDAQDTLRNWIAECLDNTDPGADPYRELYTAWSQWCEESGERPGTRKAFSQALIDHGHFIRHTKKGSVLRGLALRS